jgi:hypothetical protein
MIDTHHLTYAGVLLVFFAGAAIVAVSAFLLLGTAWLTAMAVRCIKRRTPHKLPGRVDKRRNAVEHALPMEEALRQAAAGKAAYKQEQTAPLHAHPGPDGKTASGISFPRVNYMCGRLMPGSLKQVPRMKFEGPAQGAKT